MYCKQNIHNILIIFTFTLIFLLNNLPKSVYSQVGGSTSEAVPQEWVSILNPVHNQKFGIDEGITVSGESSDTSEKDCIVAVIVNNIKPYQKLNQLVQVGLLIILNGSLFYVKVTPN